MSPRFSARDGCGECRERWTDIDESTTTICWWQRRTGAGVPIRSVLLVTVAAPAITFALPVQATWGAEVDRDPMDPDDVPGDAPPADLILVGCVKSKARAPAPAKELYVSPLFRREREFAETSGRPWFVLSAEYGLVAPGEWISPYERHLPDTPLGYRQVWGAWVTERLTMLAGSLAGTVIDIHAGAAYADAVAGPLTGKGATVRRPLAGLSMGQRLQWYAARQAALTPVTALPPPDDSGAVVAQLLDSAAAVSPGTFLASDRRTLAVPGLYSWWIDADGAANLSDGLGLPVDAGLIYAGLAGATRWPSGKRSTNTLWSRIAGMHLGGRHEFSTFRRTLGSVLAAADGRDHIDEQHLTAWMTRHLAVRTIPHPDPDTLGHLERRVLDDIDPPLNLQGMASTPIRAQLRLLRRPHARRS
jgi:hypothetical protein